MDGIQRTLNQFSVNLGGQCLADTWNALAQDDIPSAFTLDQVTYEGAEVRGQHIEQIPV